MLPPFQKVNVV